MDLKRVNEDQSNDPGQVLTQFQVRAKAMRMELVTAGRIHRTCKAWCGHDTEPDYLLQQINVRVFGDVEGLMQNIRTVTAAVRSFYNYPADQPGFRNGLTIIPTLEGKPYFKDSGGCSWRVYEFIKHTSTFERAHNANQARGHGRGFGDFQRIVTQIPVTALKETIPSFHDLTKRLEELVAMVDADRVNRVKGVPAEMEQTLSLSLDVLPLYQSFAGGKVPQRVIHNDTKLNNLLFDREGQPLCVIDLDTVMPGCIHFDFGDAIRSGAAVLTEDDTATDRALIDLDLVAAFADGFLEQVGSELVEEEWETLYAAPAMMTFIMAVRFLTDYLQGDVYYQISSPDQNLIRARNQMNLTRDILEKKERIREIVERCWERYGRVGG